MDIEKADPIEQPSSAFFVVNFRSFIYSFRLPKDEMPLTLMLGDVTPKSLLYSA